MNIAPCLDHNPQVARSRGRPRGFDPVAAVLIGESLFHAEGYDAVGVAALTKAIGINAASFYAAFGSKAAFFERVLAGYAERVLPLDAILRPGRDLIDALADLLAQAATEYARDDQRSGCLVLKNSRLGSEEATSRARTVAGSRRARLSQFIAITHPKQAAAVTDFVSTTMSGLSGSAREGLDADRLLGVARIAADAVRLLLAEHAAEIADRHDVKESVGERR